MKGEILLDSIQDKRDRIDKLTAGLKASMQLESLFPGIFDHGSPRIKWRTSMAPAPSRRYEYTGIIIDGRGR